MNKQILLFILPLLSGCGTLAAAGGAGDWPYASLDHKRPLIIAHRGASGALPEHTIPAYLRAISDGADCIEPDLVMTRDGVLVDRHDTYLSTTTDIASHPEFSDRKRKSSDAEFPDREDWWVADFTLAELKTLRAIQPFRGRSKAYDGLYQIPTFDEVMDVALTHRTVNGDPVCIYPEGKSPAYHASLGLDMVEAMDAALANKWFGATGAPVFIQSFEPEFVKAMHERHRHPVVMLVGSRADYDRALAMEGAPFWDGLGPSIPVLFNADGSSSGVLEAAHAKGIVVHPWTFRDDAPMQNAPFNGEPAEASIKRTLALGVDGFFTDFSNTGFRVRSEIARGAAAE